jgi:histidyl-tRNA synthetase
MNTIKNILKNSNLAIGDYEPTEISCASLIEAICHVYGIENVPLKKALASVHKGIFDAIDKNNYDEVLNFIHKVLFKIVFRGNKEEFEKEKEKLKLYVGTSPRLFHLTSRSPEGLNFLHAIDQYVKNHHH